MVVFNCDSCGDVVKKPKIFNHMQSCAAWSFTCIDCSRTFDQQSVQGHTSCVTEHDNKAALEMQCLQCVLYEQGNADGPCKRRQTPATG
ncbi:hypothetical protein WJX72_001298 [[Myrmecia] bisecta]|uniref:Zinc finger C2H2 LYAR-type domain-containing protein n=1 Tax=[Myrmecia] bisecta TaxID=41462 RepID=A0AAW1QE76_9CHLO